MFQRIGRCVVPLLALFTSACAEVPESDPRYTDRSHLLPIWIIEDDPNVLQLERKDLDRDRGIEKMLVIPVYSNYRREGGTDQIAIAHPFLCRPGEEVEERLRSFGQRQQLVLLVIWARGYFPDSIGGNFIWSPVVNGKRMIVMELQRCQGPEAKEISAAMIELLQEGHFVVGDSPERPPIPNTREAIRVDFDYDATQVVRSVGYDSRFFQLGYTHATHLLWVYDVGTKIVNRFTVEEKKMVADFAAGDDSAKSAKPAEETLDGKYTGDGWSLIFEHGKCYCTKPGTNDKERAEAKYVVKDGKVYIEGGKQMTRNAWPVYTIKGDSLEFSHVEDMDTGEAFYKDLMGSVVLIREVQ